MNEGVSYLLQVWNSTQQDWVTTKVYDRRDSAIDAADASAKEHGFWYRVLRTELYYETNSKKEETARSNK